MATSSFNIGDLNSDIAALNGNITTLNTSAYDTLTLNTGVTGRIYIGRLGKTRIITGYAQTDNPGVNIIIATLASTDRPPVGINAACSGYNVGAQCELSIDNTTGNIFLTVPASGNNNSVKFNVTWFVN